MAYMMDFISVGFGVIVIKKKKSISPHRMNFYFTDVSFTTLLHEHAFLDKTLQTPEQVLHLAKNAIIVLALQFEL